jgi:hypothetical protein
MIMLVFGFHPAADFVNEALMLAAASGAVRTPGSSRLPATDRFFINPGRPLCDPINVVFTRIVNDYSIVHGTTAGGATTGLPGRTS